MKKFFLLFLTVFFSGCDAVYQYVVYPPPYIEYTLVPDIEMLRAANDSCYRISRDSTTLVYDRKDWKIEVKYMTDYQLNTYDFPDISTQKELSGNPYTFGNWVDEKLGYTPHRFLNMKVALYNYSSSKINLNPEQSMAETDRGDVVVPYGIARLKARYKSFEEYFQKAKGAGGSDEQLYDDRMGVIRRTAFVLSRPLFAGDSRDGIVSYDPVDPSVERVKVTYNNVILGYDENNEPSRFTTVAFYFKRVPMVRAKPSGAAATAQLAKKDTSAKSAALRDLIKGAINIRLLQSDFLLSARIDKRETRYWDPLPSAIPAMIDNLAREGGVKAGVVMGRPDRTFLAEANVMMVACGTEMPVFTDAMIREIADAIKNKSFLFIDDGTAVKERTYSYENFMREFLEKVGKAVDPSARIDVIPQSHSLYGNLVAPSNAPAKKTAHQLVGLFVKGELIALGTTNSLYQQWDPGSEATQELKDEALRIGRNIFIYGGSKKFSSQNGIGR